MLEDLYPLTTKDIEAIGRSRANRIIPNNLKIWMYASLILCIVGLYCAYAVNAMAGIIIMIVGCVVLWAYSSSIDKKRKYIVKRLKREWREGQEAERVK